jgi:hypothetical protein
MYDRNVMLISDICTSQRGSRTEASQESRNNLRPSVAVATQGNKIQGRQSHRSTRGGARHGSKARLRHRVGAGTGNPGGCGSTRPCRAANPIERPHTSSAFLLVSPPTSWTEAGQLRHAITSHAAAPLLRPVVLHAPPPHAFPFQESSGLPPILTPLFLPFRPLLVWAPSTARFPCVERINNDWAGRPPSPLWLRFVQFYALFIWIAGGAWVRSPWAVVVVGSLLRALLNGYF